MANLPESSTFDAGVYQLELTDPVVGGPSGVSNAPLKNLANRTRYLKDRLDTVVGLVGSLNGYFGTSASSYTLTANDIGKAVYLTGDVAQTLSLPAGSALPVGSTFYVFKYAGTATIVANGSNMIDNRTSAASTISLLGGEEVYLTWTGSLWIVIGGSYSVRVHAQTPAQFDNDTSLATTEFVQRALGNMAGQGGYSGNATIGPSDIGKRINTTSASNITLTVPDPTSYPVGSTFLVHNTGGGGVTTLVPAVAGTLNNGGTLGNIALAAQSYVWLTKTDANYWLAIGGSAHIGKTAEFASSVASSGYQKLPSGLIVQWGTTTVTTSVIAENNAFYYGTALATLPIAFPNACLGSQVTVNGDIANMQLASGGTNNTTSVHLYAFSTGNNQALSVYWTAIGY